MKNLNVNPVIGIYIALDEEFAHLLEVELIAQFGRKDLGDGPLLNLTDGGDGIAGAILGPRPDDVKRKISLGNTGKHLLDSTKKRLSDLKKGKPGHPRSAETREKIRIAHLGKPKITNSLKGRTWDEIYGKEAADIGRLKNTRKNKR